MQAAAVFVLAAAAVAAAHVLSGLYIEARYVAVHCVRLSNVRRIVLVLPHYVYDSSAGCTICGGPCREDMPAFPAGAPRHGSRVRPPPPSREVEGSNVRQGDLKKRRLSGAPRGDCAPLARSPARSFLASAEGSACVSPSEERPGVASSSRASPSASIGTTLALDSFLEAGGTLAVYQLAEPGGVFPTAGRVATEDVPAALRAQDGCSAFTGLPGLHDVALSQRVVKSDGDGVSARMCDACNRSLKRPMSSGSAPPRSEIAHGFFVGELPAALQDSTWQELRLITMVSISMRVRVLRGGAQRVIRSHVGPSTRAPVPS